MRTVLLTAAIALAACGGGAGMRVYRGTLTEVVTVMGATTTNTYSGRSLTVLQDGVDPSHWTFDLSDDYLPAEGVAAGDSLTFASGQSRTTNMNGTVSSFTINTGNGSMSPQVLNLTLALSFSASGTGVSRAGTEALTFSGDRL